jgi:hypothetical protein
MNDRQNPLPIQTVVDAINVTLSSSWLSLATYDNMTSSVSGMTTTLSFFEDGAKIGVAEIFFESPANYSVTLKRFLNDDDGVELEDDDGTKLNLD